MTRERAHALVARIDAEYAGKIAATIVPCHSPGARQHRSVYVLLRLLVGGHRVQWTVQSACQLDLALEAWAVWLLSPAEVEALARPAPTVPKTNVFPAEERVGRAARVPQTG